MEGPLSGVRVADFSWVWAGGYATQLLALLGAEVIKVESRKRPDSPRLYTLSAGDVYSDLDASPTFNHLNLNKKSVTLNLSTPKGIELARCLIAKSDVLAHNMGPGAMERLGLGYEDASKINPKIVYLSASCSGTSGPRGKDVGFAPVFAALGGLSDLTGYEDGPPTLSMGEMDMLCGTASAFAVIVGLMQREATNEGLFIDLSFAEAVAGLLGDAFAELCLTGVLPKRQGNKDEILAPHDGFRAKGEDAWVAIAVETDEEFARLAALMDNPNLAQDPRFADAFSRHKNQDELKPIIEAWTLTQEPKSLVGLLQDHGIAASVAFSAKDLIQDPHLTERGAFVSVNHPRLGRQLTAQPPWRLSETPARIASPAPLIGEHNGYVLGELLGMGPEEIKQLENEGVIH